MKRLAIVMLACMALSGCAHVAQYQRGYVAGYMQHHAPTLKGKALVITDVDQDTKAYTVRPSSLTGAATTFKANVGEFLRDVFMEVLSHTFSDGAGHAHELSQEADAYTLVVRPQLLTFDYRYNQLKNLGILITPEARTEVRVAMVDREGRLLLEQRYDSGFVSGGSYMVDFQPGEKINRAVHRALVMVAEQAANEIEETLQRQQRGERE